MNILSWNVNGLRALCKKGQFDWLLRHSPDIFCLQMFLQRIQVNSSIRRKYAQIEPPVGTNHDRFGDLASGNMLNRRKLFGGINRLMLGDFIRTVLVVKIL